MTVTGRLLSIRERFPMVSAGVGPADGVLGWAGLGWAGPTWEVVSIPFQEAFKPRLEGSLPELLQNRKR